jgi:small ligand-binding sensory domain FIST
MGGMASGGIEPGDTRLFLDDRVVETGAVGARVPGIRIRALVSQGCRAIGNVYAVTRAEGNVIHELGGRPPLQRLQELVETLPPGDRELVGRGLNVGRVIDEYKAELERGDFLIRGVLGVDPQSGALAVGDKIEVGETIQFHVRDAATADEDLRTLLEREAEPAAGALLFTCNGRGSRLFSVPNHDASLVSEKLGGLPLAGFNCAGEIGPVGGKNFLHGFTASIGPVRRRLMRGGSIRPRAITPVRRTRSPIGHARCAARPRPPRGRRPERRGSRGIGRPQAGASLAGPAR